MRGGFGKLRQELIRCAAFKIMAKKGYVAVYDVLLAFSNDETGLSFPGHQFIADQTGFSARTVSRHCEALVRLGVLVVERAQAGTGRPIIYRIVTEFEKLQEEAAESLMEDDTGLSPSHSQEGDRGLSPCSGTTGDTCVPRGCQVEPKRVTETSPEDDKPVSTIQRVQRYTEQQQRTPAPNDDPPTRVSGVAAAGCARTKPSVAPESKHAILAALRSAGVVSQKVLEELSSGGITVSDVHEAASQYVGRPAYLVQYLRAVANQARGDEASDQPVRLGEGLDTARQQKAKQTDEDREILEREDHAVAWVATIEDAVLVELYDRMIEVYPDSVGMGLRPPSDRSIQQRADFLRSLLAVELWRFAQSEHAAKPTDGANGKRRTSDMHRIAESVTRPVLRSQGLPDGAKSSESDEQRSPIKLPAVGGQHRLRLPQLTL